MQKVQAFPDPARARSHPSPFSQPLRVPIDDKRVVSEYVICIPRASSTDIGPLIRVAGVHEVDPRLDQKV